eukprot:4441570-Pleurochrysis_carterae.AAC.1
MFTDADTPALPSPLTHATDSAPIGRALATAGCALAAALAPSIATTIFASHALPRTTPNLRRNAACASLCGQARRETRTASSTPELRSWPPM